MSVPKRINQPHLRKALRLFIVDVLKQNVDVGLRVFPSRLINIFHLELPCILVYFTNDMPVRKTAQSLSIPRKLDISIEILHYANKSNETDVDDFLDSRSYEIEHALLDEFVSIEGEQFIEEINWEGTEPLNYAKESGEVSIAAQKLKFSINYITEFGDQSEVNEFLIFENVINSIDNGSNQDLVTIRDE